MGERLLFPQPKTKGRQDRGSGGGQTDKQKQTLSIVEGGGAVVCSGGIEVEQEEEGVPCPSGLHLALSRQVAHLAAVVAAVVGARRPAVARYVPTLIAAVADVGDGVVPSGLGAVAADVAQVSTVVALAVVPLAVGAVPRDVSQLAAQVALGRHAGTTPSLILFAVPGDVALLVADVACLLLLLAFAGNVAHLAAVVARHLVWPVLAVLGDVAGAVAAVTPVLSLLAVPGKVPYPVALVALLPDGRLVVHAAAAAASSAAPTPGPQSSSAPATSAASVLETLAGKVSQLVALVALRGGTHAPPPQSAPLDSLPRSAPRLPPAAAAPPGSSA